MVVKFLIRGLFKKNPNQINVTSRDRSCIISYFPIIVSVWVGDNFTGGQQRFRRIYFKLYSSHSITTEIEDKSCITQNVHPLNRTEQTQEFFTFYGRSFQPNCSFESWFDIINNWCCIKLHQSRIGSLGLSYSKCVRCGEQQWRESLFVLNPPETLSCSPPSWSRGWRLLAASVSTSHASLIRINRITQHKVLT